MRVGTIQPDGTVVLRGTTVPLPVRYRPADLVLTAGQDVMCEVIDRQVAVVQVAEPWPSLISGGPWQAISLTNGWTNFGGEYSSVGYRRQLDGTVRLRGLLEGSVNTNTLIATLPVGFRPLTGSVALPTRTDTGATCFIRVRTTGTVEYRAGPASPAWVLLDGLTFPTD